MQLFRRSVFRLASSPSLSSRSITTSTPFALRSTARGPISSSVFRRFISSDFVEERATNASESTPREEKAQTYAFDAPGHESDERVRIVRPAPTLPELTPNPSIYVGNLLFDITDADLHREFAQFGEVKNAKVVTDASGLSKGFGNVEFATVESATAAIEAKNQTTFEGRRIIVNYLARTTRRTVKNPPSKTLFIGNLAFEMSDADLNKLFREIKNILDVRVAIDRRTGQPRGFAHADFVDVESASKGMELLQGKEVYGRALRIDYSAPSGARRE